MASDGQSGESSEWQKDSTYNPFEVDICSLSLPACSPDVFTKVSTPQKAGMNNSFRWSIDQVAVLRPANIDEPSQNTTTERWDDEKEHRAQKAIENFFLQNSVCPSPWNGAMAFKHVTFSPNLASTAYYSSSVSPFNKSKNTETLDKKDAWTQTTLAIPEDIDVFQLLGQFFTFLEDQRCLEESDGKDSVNSSLRRKLFSPKRLDEVDCVPISPLKFCTPQKNLLNPKIRSPSSAGTYFSSSPISVKNCSISSLVSANRVSPLLSPIVMAKEKVETERSPSTPRIKKELKLKSILKTVDCDVRNGRSPRSLSVSMCSETSSADDDASSQDLNMDAENGRCDSTHCSGMSGVQYSLDEQVLNAQCECFPSMTSHDTGYHTQSSGVESSDSINNKSDKDRLVSNWLSQSRDGKLIDSIVESSKPRSLCPSGHDSVLVSAWKPHIFSTPQ